MLSGFAAKKKYRITRDPLHYSHHAQAARTASLCNSAYDLSSSSGVKPFVAALLLQKALLPCNIFATPSYVTYVTAARDPCIHLTYRIIP